MVYAYSQWRNCLAVGAKSTKGQSGISFIQIVSEIDPVHGRAQGCDLQTQYSICLVKHK